jgi:hypothetical protein
VTRIALSPLRLVLAVALAGVVTLAGPRPTRADYHIPTYTGTPLMIASGVVTQRTLNDALRTPPRPGGGTTSVSTPSRADLRALAVRPGPSHAVAALAASAPPAQRAEAARVYQQLLDGHPQLMKQLGAPTGDLAVAAATYLAGCYMAYRGADLPDGSFAPLYRQLVATMSAERRLATASAADKRELYQRLVILGTFFAATQVALASRADPATSARLRAAAHDHLRAFLRLEPARLRLTSRGLEVAPADGAATAAPATGG